jgi:hypothetical protein
VAKDRPLSPAEHVGVLNQWCLSTMTTANQDVLSGRSRPEEFAGECSVALSGLPDPAMFSPQQAQQLVVILGLAGASIGRHYQELHESHRHTPEQAFAGVAAGVANQPFTRYFAQLADRTGTGHGYRDSYAGLVRWNLPEVQVLWAGQRLATLPGVFEDGQVRTYSGTPDESRFFGLLKASEALERAINLELQPLSDGSAGMDGEDTLRHIGRAVVLLDALRELNLDFLARTPANGMRVDYFMDIFRQFAVHWAAGDIPPSGALDVESLIRDLLLGLDLPSYPGHLRRVFPGLLGDERARLTELMDRESVPAMALRSAGLSGADLAACSAQEIARLAAGKPVLAALYLLLTAQARMAGVHLRMTKQFLFAPQRSRERAGLGDPGVVSNREGTTGMDETWLETLTRVRHHHLLRPLHVIAVHALEQFSGTDRVLRELAGPDGLQVEFLSSSRRPQLDLGVPAGLVHTPGTSRRRAYIPYPAPDLDEPKIA